MADAPANGRRRWLIESAGGRYGTPPCTMDEARELADRVFPPPLAARLSGFGQNRQAWRRSGGEANDGGGRQPVEWRRDQPETAA